MSPADLPNQSDGRTIDAALTVALDHHQAGRLTEARTAYADIVRQRPDDADATHLLGVLHGQLGETAQGVRLIARAIELNPEPVAPYLNLGVLLRKLGRDEEAEQVLRHAVARLPDDVGALNQLGAVLQVQGKLDEAAGCFERLSALQPDAADAQVSLGLVRWAQRRHDDAIAAYRRAVQRAPRRADILIRLGDALTALGRNQEADAAFRAAIVLDPRRLEAHRGFGLVLRRQRRNAEAEGALRAALAIAPNDAQAHRLLGTLYQEQGKYAEAIATLQRAVALDPQDADAHNDLGVSYQGAGNPAAAMQCFEAAIRVRPTMPEAHLNLGTALEGQSRLEEAAAAYRQAIALRPTLAGGYNNLAGVLREQGRVAESLAAYRHAVALDRNPRIHSNLIYAMDQDPDMKLADGQAERQRWYAAHRVPDTARYTSWPNPPDPERKLRIGYVSADFRRHSASYTWAPLLANHDRARFETVCYSATTREDDRTAMFRQVSDHWRLILGLSDDALARLVRDDAIDILVDLSTHTAGHRLRMFTAKPAPVQVTVFSPMGTGIREIDYLLGDPVLLPANERAMFVEHIVDLPCILTYQAPAEAPDVAPLPAAARGAVTYGCLNRFSKVTDRALTTWGRILAGDPHCRLLLKDRVFSDAEKCRTTLARLEGLGLPTARIDLRGATDQRGHLEAYGAVDIALDPFPTNGGITTLEALWMGVPVITHQGVQQAIGRVGASILSALGMPELIAHDDDGYVALALLHGADRPALAALRADMRARMRRSSVGNGALYAGAVEAAFRAMWRRWCANQRPG